MSRLLEAVNDSLVEDSQVEEVGYIIHLLESRLDNGDISFHECHEIVTGLIEQGIDLDLINDVISEGYFLVKKSMNLIYS